MGNQTRCRSCGEIVETELGQIDALLSAASSTAGEVRVINTATARTMTDRLAEGVRVRRLALEHVEGDTVRKAGA